MAAITLDIEPHGIEVPVLESAVGQHQVAAQRATLVKAVVQQRLGLDGDGAEGGFAEEAPREGGVEVGGGLHGGVGRLYLRLEGLEVDGSAEEEVAGVEAQL